MEPHLVQPLAAVERDIVQDGVPLGLAGPRGLCLGGAEGESEENEDELSHAGTVRGPVAGCNAVRRWGLMLVFPMARGDLPGQSRPGRSFQPNDVNRFVPMIRTPRRFNG